MKKHHRFLVSLLLALLLLIFPHHKTLATDEPYQPTEQEQFLEEAANQKYNQLLEEWAIIPGFKDDINANFPSFYSGAYINENKDLVIQVTETNPSIESYFNQIINLDHVVFEQVNYSYTELKQVHDAIEKTMQSNSHDPFLQTISAVGISFPKNSVNLYLVGEDEEIYSAKTRRLIHERITPFENINVIAVSGYDSPATVVYPGNAITNATHTRSVGFWAKKSDGTTGIVTAPHNNLWNGSNVFIGTTIIGQAETPYYGGSVDCVFINVTNANYTPTRFVGGHGFNLYSNGSTMLAVGSTTYSRGVTSGAQTGTVQDISYTTNNSSGVNLTNCVLTSAYTQNGDSGGIVAGSGNSSYRYVAGIITAKQNSTNYQVYCKINNIISTLGISVY